MLLVWFIGRARAWAYGGLQNGGWEGTREEEGRLGNAWDETQDALHFIPKRNSVVQYLSCGVILSMSFPISPEVSFTQILKSMG